MNLAATLGQWNSDDLKKYVYLLGGKSNITRKDDRVSFISQALLNKSSLNFLWQQMDESSRRAVSVAFHNGGELNSAAFVSQYGSLPPRPQKEDDGWYGRYHKEPILFDLFVINGQIADDLMPLLTNLALEPERFDGQSYQLDEAKLLTAVESGQQLDSLIDFLRSGHQGELPPTILEWLFQVRNNQGAFKEVDAGVLIQLNKSDLMAMVQQDKVLIKVCEPLDDRTIFVRTSHLARFRKRLKSTGYLLT